MSRDDLLAAIEAGDRQAVTRHGWGEVWEILATANAPRQGCTLTELKPYAKLLGNENPAVILEALEACAGEFRPTAGEIRRYLNRRKTESHVVDVGRGRCREMAPETIGNVAELHRAGQRPCVCGFHRSQWDHDPGTWVRRCPACNGLEPGQVNEAEDLGLLEAA